MQSSEQHHAPMKAIHGEIPYVFAGPGLERLAAQRRDPAYIEAALAAADTRFVPLQGTHNIVVHEGGAPHALLLDQPEARPLLVKPASRCCSAASAAACA